MQCGWAADDALYDRANIRRFDMPPAGRHGRYERYT